jgi:tetratricopeptide (TPR) repeat protein
LERYHNPQAIRHLQICKRIWPEDPDFLLAAARSARRALSYSEAEALLEKYRQKRGLDEAVTLEELLLSAECRVDQVAGPCWRRIEQNQPETPLILEALTRGYLRQYRLVEARQCLERWLQLQPNNAQPLCFEGLFHLDYEYAGSAAETSYRRAVELDPEHEEARLGLSVALLDRRKYAEAAENLKLLQRCQPDNLKIAIGLAECYDGMGKGDEALLVVEGVLAKEPQSAPALALRGRLALENGQPADAERFLRQAIALNPIDYRCRHNLFLALQANGKEEEAQKVQKQLEEADEDLTRYNQLVTKQIVERPNDPALHCALGQLFLRRGQRAEGIRWLQSALRLDPQYAPARKALAESQSKAKGESE